MPGLVTDIMATGSGALVGLALGLVGGVAGVRLGSVLAARKQALNLVCASLVIVVGMYIMSRGFLVLAVSA